MWQCVAIGKWEPVSPGNEAMCFVFTIHLPRASLRLTKTSNMFLPRPIREALKKTHFIFGDIVQKGGRGQGPYHTMFSDEND